MIVVVCVGRVSPPQTEEHWQWRAETEKVFYPEQEAALRRLGRLAGVCEVSPATGQLTGAPGVLHLLTPPAQHVVGDNTACTSHSWKTNNELKYYRESE